jgi:hypothetical protein
MTILTLFELAAIAVALNEEGAERKTRWAVDPGLSMNWKDNLSLYKELMTK